MMDAFKKFIKKKKADTKFKDLGPGQKLSDPSAGGGGARRGPGQSSSGGGHRLSGGAPAQRSGPTDEKRRAAQAALDRLEKSRPQNQKEMLVTRQLAYIKEQARKEIAAENLRKKELEKIGAPQEASDFTMKGEAGEIVDPEKYAVTGVFYNCPIIGPEILPKREIDAKIKEFLLDQPPEEMAVTSCLLIHSCNKGREKVAACVETLSKYLDNIIQNPSELKYRKIRISNKVFQEKVSPILGAKEFLAAAGFRKEMVKKEDTGEEEGFWVFTPNDEDFASSLSELLNTLVSTAPIKPELDRNLQVLMPAQVVQRKELPPDFYSLTVEELKREQQRLTNIVERETTLRTRATREKDENIEHRLYRYAVIRVRFPDGFYLQGTFHTNEKIGDLYEYVQENLSDDDLNFSLKQSAGGFLTNMDATLSEMKLPPASVVNFILADEHAAPPESFLKSDILALVQGMN